MPGSKCFLCPDSVLTLSLCHRHLIVQIGTLRHKQAEELAPGCLTANRSSNWHTGFRAQVHNHHPTSVLLPTPHTEWRVNEPLGTLPVHNKCTQKWRQLRSSPFAKPSFSSIAGCSGCVGQGSAPTHSRFHLHEGGQKCSELCEQLERATPCSQRCHACVKMANPGPHFSRLQKSLVV